VGWGFILLGIVGLFLPVLQGVLFIFIGLLILSSEYVWAHHLLEKMKARFPTLAQKAHHATDRLRQWWERARTRCRRSTSASTSGSEKVE
jgi:uncharacterized protein YqgC (DUF456 family)